MGKPDNLWGLCGLLALGMMGCAVEDQLGGHAATGGDAGSTAAPPLPDASGPSGSVSSGEHPPTSFLEEPDGGGVAFECDIFSQDCPPGHKCNVWANDGGGAWNATRCAPIVPEPDGVGEPCTVEDSAASGLDTCVFGAICWGVDPETLEGRCVEFCQGDRSNPICTDPDMHCVGRTVPLCIPTCCPLEQDCFEGQACYPVEDDFLCIPDASGEVGGYADPCEFINVCDPGFLCLAAEVVPGCPADTAGCCTSLCQLGVDSCSALHPDLECTPWFSDGEAPPGLEHVGACVLAS